MKVFEKISKFFRLGMPGHAHAYIKHDLSPLTKKENDRVYTKFKEMRTAYEGTQNTVKLKSGKIYVNDDADPVDEFNLSNQIF